MMYFQAYQGVRREMVLRSAGPLADVYGGQLKGAIRVWSAAALFLLVSMVVFGPHFLTAGNGSLDGEGSIFRQATYILLLAVALASTGVARNPSRVLVIPLSILMALIWFSISITWAINPNVALRRLLLTTIVIWSIFALVKDVGYQGSVAIIRAALSLLIITNYLAVLIWPDVGVHQFGTEPDQSLDGSWRGILSQKNLAAPSCAFLVIFFLIDAKHVPSTMRFALIIAGAYFLYRTNSKTSLGVLVISLSVAWVYGRYDPRFRVLVAHFLVLGAACVALWCFVNWTYLSAPFHRVDSFTGRVQIWPVLLRYSSDNLLLGSGFGSFWNIGPASPVYSYGRGWIVNITSGHNGYLDLLVQVGLPGLVLAVLSAILFPLLKMTTLVGLDRRRGTLLIACITFAVMHNFTETSLFDRDSTVHAFLMLSVALLGVESARVSRDANLGRLRSLAT